MKLRPCRDDDIDQLMTWFTSAAAVTQWAGPRFRYPFDRHSFVQDLRTGSVASYALQDEGASCIGFGQYYERWGRMNIARLAVRPASRGRGIGKVLVTELLAQASGDLSLDEFSLFVYPDNVAAIALYEGLGFVTVDCPHPEPRLADCRYMICNAQDRRPTQR